MYKIKKNEKNKRLERNIISIFAVFIMLFSIVTVVSVSADYKFGVDYYIGIGDASFVMWGEEGQPDSIFRGGFVGEFMEAMAEYPDGVPEGTFINKAKWVFYSYALLIDARDLRYSATNSGVVDISVSNGQNIEIAFNTIESDFGETYLKLDTTHLTQEDITLLSNSIKIGSQVYMPVINPDENNDNIDNNEMNNIENEFFGFDNTIAYTEPNYQQLDNNLMETKYNILSQHRSVEPDYNGWFTQDGLEFSNEEIDMPWLKDAPSVIFARTGREKSREIYKFDSQGNPILYHYPADEVNGDNDAVDGYIELMPTCEQKSYFHQAFCDCMKDGYDSCTGAGGVVIPDSDIFKINLDTNNFPLESQPHHPKCDIDGDHIPNGKDDDMDGDGIVNGMDNDMDGDGIDDIVDDFIDRSPFCDFYVLSLWWNMEPSWILWGDIEYTIPMPIIEGGGTNPQNEDAYKEGQTNTKEENQLDESLTVDVAGPYYGNIDEVIQFTGYAFGGAPPYNFKWNFGDSSEYEYGYTELTENTDSYPAHVYSEPGTYALTLTVTDGLKNTAKDTTTVIVENSADPDTSDDLNDDAQKENRFALLFERLAELVTGQIKLSEFLEYYF